jgi:LysR family transcriptional regulator, benzoate and cis,cis-muconate-responsive activator of ben and cat genes
MDLRQLKYFIAVAEERSFSRAAIRLHVSQPPITRQIKMLEDSLGIQLFDRTHWGVELTQAGDAFLANAYGIRAMVDHASDRARRIGKGTAGRLDVGLVGSGMLSIVPEILRRYSAAHPDVDVVLLHGSRFAQLDALHQNRLLIAFDRHLPDAPDLVVEVVATETQVLALREDNPLASYRVVPIELVRDQPMILARDASHSGRIAALCRANGFEPRVGQRAGDIVSGLAMIANGFGVDIVPESVKALRLPGLVYRPLRFRSDAYATLDLQCAYRRGDASPLLADILDVVRAYRSEHAQSQARAASGRSAKVKVARGRR